ncbi:hypothetical protein HCC61_04175 [Streptomyces sp. HNM0575]|uniref:hypothetical protein n=1 Tax=Streptomyces sp. HNM0575 TaxID=2716338 RepID=UPI00145DF65C|nr:hypothetical protein [Streptomyces sp. HNM0575]NLU71888.1 hypothetical protein [Streptomyces sp. HNM0575]
MSGKVEEFEIRAVLMLRDGSALGAPLGAVTIKDGGEFSESARIPKDTSPGEYQVVLKDEDFSVESSFDVE